MKDSLLPFLTDLSLFLLQDFKSKDEELYQVTIPFLFKKYNKLQYTYCMAQMLSEGEVTYTH